jgi:hypothetical protein
MIIQLEIPRHCNNCLDCQAVLAPGSAYYSMLVKTDRLDYCYLCWHDESKAISSRPSTCYWKGSIPMRKASAKPSLTKQERALEQLKSMLLDPTPENSSQALLLALFLVRRRFLVFRRDFVDESGEVYSLFEVVETEEMLPVKKVPLVNLDLVGLQAAIAEKLQARV